MNSTLPGQLLAGRYRLVEVIGRGGMGVVWRARDERIERKVAIKELVWPDGFTAEEQQAACRHAAREAWIAAQISHRNVIQVFDLVEVDGCPWIVMELLPPRSLHQQVQAEGPLSPQRTAAIGLEVLAALKAAHKQHILHLDVKPGNILLAADRVVLSDFGIAMVDGTAPLSAGQLVGSPSYIAPERAQGQEPGPPADLWGLGATLYTAVEGHSPFNRNGDPQASLAAAVNDEPELVVRAGPLWPVINGLLHKNPATRLTAAEVEPLLRRVAAAGRVAPRHPGETPPRAAAVPGRHAASQPRRHAMASRPPTLRWQASATRREMRTTVPWEAAG
jgi:eukaryotic-like serine/threonine-protein kinase